MRSNLIFVSIGILISLACLSTTTALPTIDFQQAVSGTLTAQVVHESSAIPESTATDLPTSTPAQPLIQSPTPASANQPACIPQDAPVEIGLVMQVIDGDTISVMLGDQVYPVRYIGIDAPETRAPGEPVEPLGQESAAVNRELVDGQIVTLIKDVSETDRFNRLLRYVFVPDLNGLFVNYALVRLGYAQAVSYPPDVACHAYFQEAEREARRNKVGLWAPLPIPIAPPDAGPPTPTAPMNPTPRNCPEGQWDPSYPTVCIPPPPPDLDCKDIPYRRFKVLPPDPHNFDGDHDGIGCES